MVRNALLEVCEEHQGQQRRARGTPQRDGKRAVYSRGDAQQIVEDLGRQMIASSWGLEEAPRSPEQASCPLVLACRCLKTWQAVGCEVDQNG